LVSPGGPLSDLLVLCYHAVSERWPSVLAVTPEQLERQLSHLVARGYRGSTFDDAIHRRMAERTLAVTFDDAYRSVFTIARPILERLGLPGTVFAPTRLVDTDEPMSWPGIDQWLGSPHRDELVPMSWEQMGILTDSGWEIGSHTRTHQRLTKISAEALADELEGSRADCERALGRSCRSLSYPFGDEDQRVLEGAKAAGYTSAGALPSPLLHRPAQLRWPRVGVYRGDSMTRFRRKVSPSLRLLRRTSAWKLVVARHRFTR
jgi:peptidoglycan/xylan/chitin deacetylase (PgdA/CDA1 family)